MLENFSDHEIEYELLGTGVLSALDSECEPLRIETVYLGRTMYKYSFRRRDGEPKTHTYRSLTELLFCQDLTFDNLRKNWTYSGVLLSSPDFCKRLVR